MERMMLKFSVQKSGCTPETRNGWLEVQKAFREAGLDFPKEAIIIQGVAIRQENSLLDNTARIEGWIARFPMFDWVGGVERQRCLQLAYFQQPLREILAGASLMDEANRGEGVGSKLYPPIEDGNAGAYQCGLLLNGMEISVRIDEQHDHFVSEKVGNSEK
ncbi:unnamed protein product [Sphenostylis stenocarpa]|uniref:Uncharacterized protein n=1 Tax=Sphenostylis stenocarpa TaxID=92480 RepID=A0AA86TP05_9FABA|nr:unnamed protein product [Sphenostylis stenocarpa]